MNGNSVEREKALKEAHEKELEGARQEAELEKARAYVQEQEALAERLKRSQDKAHRRAVRSEIAKALEAHIAGMTDLGKVCEEIAEALMAGAIPHCEVRL